MVSSIVQIQYYLKTGTCKFGATCKYHHPRDQAGSTGRVQLNVVGLPLRTVSLSIWLDDSYVSGFFVTLSRGTFLIAVF